MGSPNTDTEKVIFHLDKSKFLSEPAEQAEAELRELGMRDFNKEEYRTHVDQVKELTDKIIDIFEEKDYTATVALDAIESVLRGGVALTLGDRAGSLLQTHLERFHKQMAALQVVEMIGDLLHRTRGEKKTGVNDLLAEMNKMSGDKPKE